MAEYNNGMWVCQCQYRKECNRDCGMYRKLSGKLSNADRIRAMTDEELAEWLAEHDAGLIANVLNNDYCAPTIGSWFDWLKQEAV